MQKLQNLVAAFKGKNLPSFVKIVEMGPRDGLQSEKTLVKSDVKVEFINKLSACGYKGIEVTSFVSPKWVPQMGDNSEVFQRVFKKPGVTYSALTPNFKGYESAMKVGVQEVAIFASASEGFSQKNINCSIDDSFDRFRPIMQAAYRDKVKVRGYVSCVFACPYDGDIEVEKTRSVALKLKEMGCYEVSLGDTIGVGTPGKTAALLKAILNDLKPSEVAVHFHNTFDRAVGNILTALEMGIHVVDSSVGSLGGCPYADGATGNVSTEDVVFVLHQLGVDTGLDLKEICRTANWITKVTGIPNRSSYLGEGLIEN
jgi:isopropylmalate/homocitrate/citramalate synthase